MTAVVQRLLADFSLLLPRGIVLLPEPDFSILGIWFSRKSVEQTIDFAFIVVVVH